jgi:hypothetical protein
MKPTRIVSNLVFVGLGLLVMTGCPGSSSPQIRELQPATGVGPATMEIVNASNEQILFVFMSPASEDFWGADLLGADVLQIGQTFILTNIEAGSWDIRFVDYSGNYKEYYDVDFDAGGYYRLTVTHTDWFHD